MTDEEAIQLKQAFADLQQAFFHLKEEVAQKDRRIEEREALLMRALLRNDELERRRAKKSHNRSKPPSSDGLKPKPKSHQKKSKPSGGQPGHQGRALQQVEKPDEVITHRPERCEACRHELGALAGQLRERRQIHELPELRLRVIEHRVEAMCCPTCQHGTAARFPVGVDAPAHYGPQMQALAVSLSQVQLLPMERIQERCVDLFGCQLSEGTLANWLAEAARTLEPTMLLLKRLLGWSQVTHVDETGARIKGVLHWFPVTATPWLTCSAWHRKRGQEAMNQMGILPDDKGRLVHDRWVSYDGSSCEHRVCGAHLLRDGLWRAEHDKHPWAQTMYELLFRMLQVTENFRESGAKTLPKAQRDALVLRSFEILTQGYVLTPASFRLCRTLRDQRRGEK